MALCGRSRATLLTGRQSNAHGFTRNGTRFDNNVWVWPRALSQAGYATAMFGKSHINASPAGIGFDDWKVLRSEEHTSETQTLMRTSYDDFGLTKKTATVDKNTHRT